MLSASLVLLLGAATFVAANPLAKRQSPWFDQQTGDATVYDVGPDACGGFDQPTDFIVAVSHLFFDTFPGATSNPNNNPVCGKTVTASYQGRQIQVTIKDRCEACAFGDLDFSQSAFEALIGPVSIGRAHGMTWQINGGGSNPPPPPPSGNCTQFYTVQSGDTCSAIAAQFGISVATFEGLNPNINSQCTNLQIGTAYCVGTGGGGSTP
ncbi:hypothetical protein EXIGLDRAFT_641852, partial [Exidia glandulosa HHB12029]